MVKGLYLTPIDNQIINMICDIQIDSFCRIHANDCTIDVDLRRAGLRFSRTDLDYELASQIEKFENIKSNKQLFAELEHAEINRVKALLLNFAEDFEAAFKHNLPKFWHKIFLMSFIHDHIN